MSSQTCKHITLAQSPVAHVQRCTECNGVSIHLGPITVRVAPEALEALWLVLGEATAALDAQQRANVALRGVA
jgi:hypothetical protein